MLGHLTVIQTQIYLSDLKICIFGRMFLKYFRRYKHRIHKLCIFPILSLKKIKLRSLRSPERSSPCEMIPQFSAINKNSKILLILVALHTISVKNASSSHFLVALSVSLHSNTALMQLPASKLMMLNWRNPLARTLSN